MPLYEYRCCDCETESELLVRNGEQPSCPACRSRKLEKLLSVPSTPAVSSTSSLPVQQAGGCGLPQCGSGGCQGGF